MNHPFAPLVFAPLLLGSSAPAAQEPAFGHLRHGIQIDSQATFQGSAAGDVDGDGLPELVTATPLRLWQADERGRFLQPPETLSQYGFDPVLVDVDGDGDLDLLAGTIVGPPTSPAYVLMFRNDGSGNFADDSASLPPGNPVSYAPRPGDLDGDGDPDLVVSTTLPRLRTLWMNDGTGAFLDAGANLPSGARAYTSRTLDDSPFTSRSLHTSIGVEM